MNETLQRKPVGTQMDEKYFRDKPLEERTDHELEISKILLQRETNKKLESISNNLSFFFWLTIVSIVFGVIAAIVAAEY